MDARYGGEEETEGMREKLGRGREGKSEKHMDGEGKMGRRTGRERWCAERKGKERDEEHSKRKGEGGRRKEEEGLGW